MCNVVPGFREYLLKSTAREGHRVRGVRGRGREARKTLISSTSMSRPVRVIRIAPVLRGVESGVCFGQSWDRADRRQPLHGRIDHAPSVSPWSAGGVVQMLGTQPKLGKEVLTVPADKPVLRLQRADQHVRPRRLCARGLWPRAHRAPPLYPPACSARGLFAVPMSNIGIRLAWRQRRRRHRSTTDRHPRSSNSTARLERAFSLGRPMSALSADRSAARAVDGRRTPVESPNTLRSISSFHIVDLISEGEIFWPRQRYAVGATSTARRWRIRMGR